MLSQHGREEAVAKGGGWSALMQCLDVEVRCVSQIWAWTRGRSRTDAKLGRVVQTQSSGL